MINIETTKTLTLYKSTKEKRLVTLCKGSPLNVVSVNKNLIPFWFREYDQIAYVNMGVIQVEEKILGQLSSSDGIPIEAYIQINIKFHENDEKIKRIVSNYKGEERLLLSTIIRYLQLFLGVIKSVDVIRELNNSTSHLIQNIKNIEGEIDSPFQIINIIISQLNIGNKEIAEIVEKTIRDREKELSKKELLQIKLENHAKEQELEEADIKGAIVIEKLKNQHDLELEETKHKQEITRMNNVSNILKTEEGRMVRYPKEIFSLLSQEIKLKSRESRDKQEIIYSFFNQLMDNGNAYQTGQLNALKAMVEKHYDIKLTDISIYGKNIEKNQLGHSNKHEVENKE